MFSLPISLQHAIEREAERFTQQKMAQARDALSQRYRNRQWGFCDDVERIAYLAARMPATFAAVSRVLQEVHTPIKSLLDLGAGPGTVMWAACALFPEIEQITLFECDKGLSELGQRLASQCPLEAIRQARWQTADLENLDTLPPHDLVVLSYSLGELTANNTVIQHAWKAANKMLVVIEPGTPAGFEQIRAARDQLISLGGHMVAPCPHMRACPMSGGDWCHFAVRVERSSLHRRLKHAELGYEDEKYSYVIFSKEPHTLPSSRVLRHPLKRTGHLVLTLCAQNGLEEKTLSKKMGDAYKLAKKLEWGSAY